MLLVEKQVLLIVAFIPRSGSNYLCDMLRRTGLAAPLEYYYPYDFEARRLFWNNISDGDRIDSDLIIDPDQWFNYVASRGAVKLTWHSHIKMRKEASISLDGLNIKYLYLRRHDKLRQAISWVKADQSGQWTSLDASKNNCHYDYDQIKQRLIDIIDQEARWNRFFENVPHMDIFYEDIDYGAISKIENWLGMQRLQDYWETNKKIMTQYSIMRDKETEQWVNQFIGS